MMDVTVLDRVPALVNAIRNAHYQLEERVMAGKLAAEFGKPGATRESVACALKMEPHNIRFHLEKLLTRLHLNPNNAGDVSDFCDAWRTLEREQGEPDVPQEADDEQALSDALLPSPHRVATLYLTRLPAYLHPTARLLAEGKTTLEVAAIQKLSESGAKMRICHVWVGLDFYLAPRKLWHERPAILAEALQLVGKETAPVPGSVPGPARAPKTDDGVRIVRCDAPGYEELKNQLLKEKFVKETVRPLSPEELGAEFQPGVIVWAAVFVKKRSP